MAPTDNYTYSSHFATGRTDDLFEDLIWERELREERRQAAARRSRPVNLTAEIEDYFRSSF